MPFSPKEKVYFQTSQLFQDKWKELYDLADSSARIHLSVDEKRVWDRSLDCSGCSYLLCFSYSGVIINWSLLDENLRRKICSKQCNGCWAMTPDYCCFGQMPPKIRASWMLRSQQQLLHSTTSPFWAALTKVDTKNHLYFAMSCCPETAQQPIAIPGTVLWVLAGFLDRDLRGM